VAKEALRGVGFQREGGLPSLPLVAGGGGAALRPIEYGFWRSQNATGAEPRPPHLQNSQALLQLNINPFITPRKSKQSIYSKIDL
jgi:hypothetical protein